MENNVILVCREVNLESGDVAVYRMDAEPTGRVLFCLGIRARMNKELRYFVCAERWRENFEQLTQILGKNLVVSGAVLNKFGIAEL